jgi:hypothetical protein
MGAAAWTPERLSSTTRNIIMVVLGGIALGVFAVLANLYWIAAIVAGVLLVGLVAWRYESALMVYVLVAFIPWGRTPDIAAGGSGLGKGLYISEMMLGFLLIIWFAKYLFRALPGNRIRTGFHVPIILYLVYSIINVINSFIFWDYHIDRAYQYQTVNVIELGLRFMSAGAFIMAATSLSNTKWLKRTTLFILLPGVYSLVNFLLHNKLPFSAGDWWPLIVILPSCYMCAIALDADNSPLKRLGASLFVALSVVTILIINISWVSGWLGLGVALGVVILIKSRKLFVIACLVVLACTVILWPIINDNVIQPSQKEGDYDRFALMAGSWKYATTFPLGVGLGNYRSYNSFYYGKEWGTATYTSAHGTYSQHLAEMGIPGLCLLLVLLCSGFAWLLKSYGKMSGRLSKTFLLATMGYLAGIAFSAIIGDYIVPAYHNGGIVNFSTTVYLWLACGLAVAHVRIETAEVKEDSSSEAIGTI